MDCLVRGKKEKEEKKAVMPISDFRYFAKYFSILTTEKPFQKFMLKQGAN